MKIEVLGALLAVAIAASGQTYASDCWVITNIRGYSAYADQTYKFNPDGLQVPVTLCFTSTGGTVTGTDIRFVKFGESTLAGFGGNDKGDELFEVYQIDREKKKLLYTKTRIGTKTVMPIFSDVVSAFVGEAQPTAK